jgi:hypothetical protein
LTSLLIVSILEPAAVDNILLNRDVEPLTSCLTMSSPK